MKLAGVNLGLETVIIFASGVVIGRWVLPSLVHGMAAKGGHGYGGGGYMPGWYSISGHHHCSRGQPGCACTDPKKCMGIAGTGHEQCTGGRCAPNAPHTCTAYYASDRKDCHLCPPGTGFGPCA